MRDEASLSAQSQYLERVLVKPVLEALNIEARFSINLRQSDVLRRCLVLGSIVTSKTFGNLYGFLVEQLFEQDKIWPMPRREENTVMSAVAELPEWWRNFRLLPRDIGVPMDAWLVS